ncbi:MAG: RNA polymerase sporulation sigma factor SigG [Clostridia bacterium]|nr:RNA polymerase sporulation sigma factor SigG [Clostridia bacterium]
MYNKVEICGINTAKLKVLSEDEKMELLTKSRAGDQEARDKLIMGNLRLVLSVLQSFSNRGENPDDLFQVGTVGLLKAIRGYNPEFGTKFSTYAVPLIAGELKRYLRDSGSIRVSRSLRDVAYKALQAKERLSAKLQREPTVEELAKETGLPSDEIVAALDAIVEPVSLYEPIYSDGGDSVYVLDQIKDTKNTDENWTTSIAISEAIEKLNKREQKILALRFFKGRTQTEVASEIGISQAQVSRIEKGALDKIRRRL